MGFGICFFANTLLLFDIFGTEVFAFALFGYGFALLMASDRRFKLGALFAGLAITPSLFKLFNTTRIIDLSNEPELNLIIHIAISVFMLLMYSVLFIGVKKIAAEGGDLKLSKQSSWVMRITFTVLILYSTAQILSLEFFNVDSSVLSALGITLILRYIMLIINTVYLYFCYATITTPQLLKKEQKSDIEYELKQKKKKEKNDSEEE
ncbi:MAG: hypothetical protein A2Y17_06295 [Clostridiales bacterium GWF2_38_85]|nr:MAG: hypothetical protein A2Y17_06295 [Clostridiales bacterium GWF2_38_85]HBL85503.1 hypothetical protein [Clostridiales bacterium]